MRKRSFDLSEEQVAVAREIVRAGPICDQCLGRAFGEIGRGYANEERGRRIRGLLEPEAFRGGAACWVCGGLFQSVDEWAAKAASLSEGWEFDSYLFGAALTPRLEETEAHFCERFPTGATESLRHALNRAIGIAFERQVGRGTVAFHDPHLSFLVDLARDTLSMHVASLYVESRYRKLVRGIPQTRWPCRACGGRGCSRCNQTGKQYPESVEEWIAAPLVEATQAEVGLLHGAGREDIDARMLGTGRPFVLELVRPRLRTVDWMRLAQEVNDAAAGRVEVAAFSPATKRRVAELKTRPSRKRYRALVGFGRAVGEGELTCALEKLVGPIEQRTPKRVAHRRADLIRVRTLHRADGRLIDEMHAELEFLTDGGLYVKELVSGDDERTEPSLAALLGCTAKVGELDVVAVLPDGPTGADPDCEGSRGREGDASVQLTVRRTDDREEEKRRLR